MPAIEDYALLGNLQTAALVSREGSVDWCCFPRFDSGACFAAILGGAQDGRWLLAPTSKPERVSRRYRHDTLILESVIETAGGSVRVIDFMPPRARTSEIVRIVEGLTGEIEMRSELVIRFDFGSIVPWMQTFDDDHVAIAGPDALLLSHAGRGARRGSEDGLHVHGLAGRADSVRPHLVSVARAAARGDRSGAGPRRHHGLLACLGRPVRSPGRLPRGGPPVAPRPESAHLRPDRGHGRSADDVASGVDRRAPQLGLPLLLAPRCDAGSARDDAVGIPRGGRDVAPVAPSRRGRRPRGRPDHVRDRGRAPARRARARLAAGLRGVDAGAGRERRFVAAPARRLRRGARRALSGARPRRTRRRQRLVAGPQAARVARGRVAARGRGDLGGSRARAPFHPLQGDGLGGLRPRGALPRGVRARRPSRALAVDSRRDPRRGARPRLERRQAGLHAVVRLGRARCERPADAARRASCPPPTSESARPSRRSGAS